MNSAPFYKFPTLIADKLLTRWLGTEVKNELLDTPQSLVHIPCPDSGAYMNHAIDLKGKPPPSVSFGPLPP